MTFNFCMIEAKPENLIGDRACDSDHLDAEMREQGTEMIAPHRSNPFVRRPMTGADCTAMSGTGSSIGSSARFSGSVGFSLAWSTTERICSASCSLRHYASCSGSFEMGSNAVCALGVRGHGSLRCARHQWRRQSVSRRRHSTSCDDDGIFADWIRNRRSDGDCCVSANQ